MKIQKIEVKNFKAISEQEATFNGCSAIITAGNNAGKTSLLRGLIDRLRGEKPEVIVKDGEKNGNSIIELSDGSVIEWKFTEKSESFSYTTKEGIKQTTGVISAIGEKYFGIKFDIDKFLNSSAKVQSTQLSKLVGLDFDDVDKRYKNAYDQRTLANAELKRIGAIAKVKPVEVEKPNIEKIKQLLISVDGENTVLKEQWKKNNEECQLKITNFNNRQNEKRLTYNSAFDSIENLKRLGFNVENLVLVLETMKPEQYKELKTIPEPEYKSTIELNQELEKANDQQRLFDSYERDLNDYNNWVSDGKQARKNANDADSKVKEIEAEKLQMISTANIPSEFEFTADGILYNGLPLSNNQLSSSAKYIAALKLGAMALGEVRTMHFDASFLDKNNLSQIQEWANENDLQLLIERPDFDGGEIKYEII